MKIALGNRGGGGVPPSLDNTDLCAELGGVEMDTGYATFQLRVSEGGREVNSGGIAPLPSCQRTITVEGDIG
jgi:hypothetical protein